MLRHQDTSISTTSRLLVAALVTLALVGVVAGVGAATEQSDQPTLRVTEDTTTADDNTSVGIVLTTVPDGLAGYYLDLAVESPADARIVNASYPDRFGLTTDPEYREDGVRLEAADLNGVIEPGATDVRLATVVVTGEDPELTVEPRQFDADDGSSFEPVYGDVLRQATPGTRATDNGPATSRTGDTADTSGGSGPLPAVLVLVAVAVLVGIGYHRSER